MFYHAETHRVHEVMKTVESEMDRLGLDEKVCTTVCPSQLLFAFNYCLPVFNYHVPSTTVYQSQLLFACLQLLSALNYCLPASNYCLP